MIIGLSLIHLTISLLALLYARNVLRAGLPSLLAIHLMVYVILVSIGVALAPFFPLENLTYISNPIPIPLIRTLSPTQYIRQCFSHWLFICIALAGLRWEVSWAKLKVDALKQISSSVFWGYIAFLVGIVFSFKYYIVGSGWTVLRETRLAFFSTSEAVAHRVSGYLAAGIGEGNYLASVAAYVIFPLAAALLSLKRKRISWAIFMLAGFFSLVYAYQTRQKAPLLWTLFTFLFLFYLSLKGNRQKDLLKRMFFGFAIIGSVGSVFLYMVNFGQTFISSIEGFFYRVFLVPAASETNFFVIFSDSLPFRGILQIFSIPWGRVSATDMVSILDVARVATGTAYSANASFLAVAWSAGGYLGIVLVSLILVAPLVALDRSYCFVPKKLFYIALALSPVHLITLISGGFSTYLGRGGLVVPLLIILLTKAPVISFKSKKLCK